jgi:hypothetical protein
MISVMPLQFCRAAGHHRLDAETLQRLCRFFHLRRAPASMRFHALAVVGNPLGPLERFFGSVERSHDFLEHARRLGRGGAFPGQRLDPFDDDRPDHLDRRGKADFATDDTDIAEAECLKQRLRREGMRPRHQQRHRHPFFDRSHHRDIDIAPASGLDRGGRLALGVGRDRVHVAPQGAVGQQRGIVARGVERRVGGDQRKQKGAIGQRGGGVIGGFDPALGHDRAPFGQDVPAARHAAPA